MAPQKVTDFFHKYSIRREMALFAKTGRPIHAWRAYYWIRQAGLPPPPWFLEYLDQCAKRLMKDAPKTAEHLAAVFDMRAKGRHTTGCEQLAAVQHVCMLKEMRPDARLEDLFAEVAEQRDKSESYVRDAYYAWFPKN